MKKYLPYIIVGVLLLAVIIVYAKKRNQASDQITAEEMNNNQFAGPSTFVQDCECENREDIQEGIVAYRNMPANFLYKQDMYNRVKELCPCAQI